MPYLYTDLNCTGSEGGIVNCPLSNQIEGDKCLYGKAVGVKCYSRCLSLVKLLWISLIILDNTGCTNGAVRLVGGSEREGDVQICRDGIWGYICDEDWSENEARVVCRDQGYNVNCKYFKAIKIISMHFPL